MRESRSIIGSLPKRRCLKKTDAQAIEKKSLCLNIEHSLIRNYYFPYRICYIWKQPLKVVSLNMCFLKLGKPNTLNKDTNILQ